MASVRGISGRGDGVISNRNREAACLVGGVGSMPGSGLEEESSTTLLVIAMTLLEIPCGGTNPGAADVGTGSIVAAAAIMRVIS